MAKASLLIYWCDDGLINVARAPQGSKVYIGRLPNPPEGEGYSVFIIDDKGRLLAKVGGPYPYVSRLHALIELGGDHEIIIRDHGSQGNGSTNGTYVDGSRLPRGGSVVKIGAAVVRLAESGPSFLVMRSDWEGDISMLLALKGAPRCLKAEIVRRVLEREDAEKIMSEECVILNTISHLASNAIIAYSSQLRDEALHYARELKKLLEENEKAKKLLSDVLSGYYEGGVDELLLAFSVDEVMAIHRLRDVMRVLGSALKEKGCVRVFRG